MYGICIGDGPTPPLSNKGKYALPTGGRFRNGPAPDARRSYACPAGSPLLTRSNARSKEDVMSWMVGIGWFLVGANLLLGNWLVAAGLAAMMALTTALDH